MKHTVLKCLFLLFPLIIASDNFVDYYLANPIVNSLQYSINPTTWKNSLISNCATVFLIHGWLGNIVPQMGESARILNQVPINESCYNAIYVTWNASYNLDYLDAASAVNPTGYSVYNFIKNLQQSGYLAGRIDCTGHSLGAHVCGVAGRKLIDSGIIFVVLTGLDPAGPFFTAELLIKDLSAYKLRDTDAQIVVTLMTNGGFLGTDASLGSINFKANNGIYQPGCNLNLACSHLRAINLYQEAILHNWYVSTSPDGHIAIFGRYMSLDSSHDNYQFFTASKPPYNPSQ